jgi:glycosyltransferase involved in cell wall biosynthesis
MIQVVRFLRQMNSTTGQVIMDGRSIRSNRTSGWERYAREISRSSKVKLIPPFPLEKVPIISDLILAALLIGHRGVVHFPTFPPLHVKNNYIFTLHDLTWWLHADTSSFLGKSFYKKLAEKTVRKAFLVVPSESVRVDLLNYFQIEENRVYVVHNGLTVLSEEPSLKSLDLPMRFILVVGTLEPRKNLNNFVTAFMESKAKEEYNLVLVGRVGWGQSPPNVSILSNLSDTELDEVYSRASAFFLPSIYEGFGLPLLEALAHGLPVFCSDISVFREVGGSSCNYFNPLNTQEIVKALNSFVDGVYVADTINSKQVWSKYTWASSGESIREVYVQVTCALESNLHD